MGSGTPVRPADFVKETLGRDPGLLDRRGIAIKFIVTAGGVIFDPGLYRDFLATHGEGGFYHSDIAAYYGLTDGQVLGGASVRIERDRVVITGASTKFGGIDGCEQMVLEYFSSYFACPVEWGWGGGR